MRNRNLVVKLLLAAIVATVCVWVWPDRAESRDPDRRDHGAHRRRQEIAEREQIGHIENLGRIIKIHERLSEIFDDAPIAGLMAINKIKEIAAHSGKLNQGIDALERIADDSPVLGLRQAALMSMHELQLADKDPRAAMNSLVRICLEFDDDDDDDDDDNDDNDDNDDDDDDNDDDDNDDDDDDN